jgi:sugar lactone lactonase YvrE
VLNATDAAGASPDSASGCGTGRPDVSNIVGTEGLVIAGDGTIYYSQPDAVGRMRPGMDQEDAWVTVAGADTIWGIALDVPNHRLFVGSPSTGHVYTIDLSATSPTATMLSFSAPAPNGLTMGTDGAMYYSDFSVGHVYRVDASGTRSRVTSTTIAQANGLAFGSDGALYVDNYHDGTIVKLTLDSNYMESARTTFATNLGSPDGLAFDADGRVYVTDNVGGRLIRLESDGTGAMILYSGLSAPANIEFGAGALSCTDFYVANGGSLYRYEMGSASGIHVPWH